MRKLLLAFTLLAPMVAVAKDHTYVPAKLVDISSSERLNEGTTLRRAIYRVQLDGIVYTLEGNRIRRHGKNESSEFTVGDAIQVSLEGEHIFIKTPDGKDTKTTVVKRERIQ